MNIFESILEAQKQNKTCILCTVIDTQGYCPQKAGAKMLVFEDGSIVGTVGGGTLEFEVIKQALSIFKNPQNKIFEYKSNDNHIKIFFDYIVPKPQIIIFGAGHVAKAVAHFANQLNFNITLIDPRENLFTQSDKKNYNCIISNYVDAIESIIFDKRTFIVIATMSHNSDLDVLINVYKREYAYIGILGSKAKAEQIANICKTKNLLKTEDFEKINIPIGIDIEAKTPQEIAISILAKIIDIKNKNIL
jgi:xanthine dehydrogenase accessory factor